MRSLINKPSLLAVGVGSICEAMCKTIAASPPEAEALGHADMQGGRWFLSLVLQDTAEGELAVPLLSFSRISRLIIRDRAEDLCVYP